MSQKFDASLLRVKIISSEIKYQALILKKRLELTKQNPRSKLADLILAVRCIDLTTLAADDSFSNVERLCDRAKNPLNASTISKHLSQELDNEQDDQSDNSIETAAVCVYPYRVRDCKQSLEKIGSSRIRIASVVAGFPAGQCPITTTISDIKFAKESGANEIDIVLNRSLIISGQWPELFSEIKAITDQCHQLGLHLKVILSCDELLNLKNLYKASMCAMMAGADFIKTSTGKETINAKLVFGLIMARAIYDFFIATGKRVGLKPAGGIKTAEDALSWIYLVRFHIGPEWMTNRLFRLGASSLLNALESEIFKILHNRQPEPYELS